MKRFLTAVCLLIIVLAICLPGLGARDFWPPDEARYGEVSRELLQGAPLFLPHLNRRIYPDKPPGFFWCVAGLKRLGGESLNMEAATRLPSVIGAAALVLLVGLWIAGICGPRGGLMAGLLLSGSLLFLWQARQAQLDMLFAALIGGMIAVFHRSVTGDRPRLALLGFLLLFLAVFVKGPVAFLGLLVIMVHVLVLRRPGAFFHRWSLLGFLVFGTLVAGWLFMAWRTAEALEPGGGNAWLDAAVWRQTAERAREGKAHLKPWFAYLLRLPIDLMPFTPFLLLLGLGRVRRAIPDAARPLMRFALLWLGVFVVVMSCFPGKREIYLLPVFPAAAMLVFLAVEGAARVMPRVLTAYAGFLGGLLLLAGEAALVLAFRPELFSEGISRLRSATWSAPLPPPGGFLQPGSAWAEAFRSHLLLFGACLLAPALATLALALAGAPRAAVGWAALTFALALGVGSAVLLPDANALSSRRPVGEMVRRHRPTAGEGPVGILRHMDEGVLFYAGPPLPEVAARLEASQAEEAREEVRRYLSRPGALLIAREKDLRRFGLVAGRDHVILERYPLRRRIFALLGARR